MYVHMRASVTLKLSFYKNETPPANFRFIFKLMGLKAVLLLPQFVEVPKISH